MSDARTRAFPLAGGARTVAFLGKLRVKRRAGAPAVAAEASFEAQPEATGAARRFVRAILDGDERTADAELVVSELATNALRHADSPFTVTLTLGERLRIEVRDRSEALPTLRAASPEAADGRGLQLVEAVASAWGVRSDAAGGKVVWVELAAWGPDPARRLDPTSHRGPTPRDG